MAESDALVPAQWAELLRGGGAARVGSDDVADADLDSWVAATDRALLVLDTQDCSTEAELLTAFGDTFGVDEDDAEGEWDQIDEYLADYDITPSSGLVIVWSGWDGLDDDPEHVIPVAVDALATAARTWADEGRPWAVLLVGDGPSWELPWAGAGPAPWEAEDDDLADDEGDDEWGEEEEISDDSYTFDEADSADQMTNW